VDADLREMSNVTKREIQLHLESRGGTMERQGVSSSNLRSVGYDSASSTLEVEFNSGGVYQYSSVPESVFSALMRASSKGIYLNDHIKDRYRCRQVR
jgi:hypothetical protein